MALFLNFYLVLTSWEDRLSFPWLKILIKKKVFYQHFEMSDVHVISFKKSGSISINSPLCSTESDARTFLANSISFLQASPLSVLRMVLINDQSGRWPSSMSRKYFISSGSSFTSFQISFTLNSLYLGIWSTESFCFA